MRARGVTDRHLKAAIGHVRAGLKALSATRIGDVDLSAVSRWLNEAKADGLRLAP
jgi:hypothetical protein